jgi:hypothetical protein
VAAALAGETFLILAVLLTTSTLGLVLGQSSRLFGAEIVVVAGGAWVFTMISRRRAARAENLKEGRGPQWWTLIGFQLAVLPLVVGGVSLVAHWGGGLYWIVVGVVESLMVVFINAWTLLIEIQR